MLKSGSELRLRDLYLNRLIAFQDTTKKEELEKSVQIISMNLRCSRKEYLC